MYGNLKSIFTVSRCKINKSPDGVSGDVCVSLCVELSVENNKNVLHWYFLSLRFLIIF